MSAYWEETLDQLNKNYMRQTKKIAREIKKLEHMDKTILAVEWKLNEIRKKDLGKSTEMVGI